MAGTNRLNKQQTSVLKTTDRKARLAEKNKALDMFTDNWVVYSHYLTEDEKGNRMSWYEWSTDSSIDAIAPVTLDIGPEVILKKAA